MWAPVSEVARIACKPIRAAILSLFVFNAMGAIAATIGANPIAEPLTRSRIQLLPAPEQSRWLSYLDRSEKQRQADKGTLQAELKKAGLSAPIDPPHSSSACSIPLRQPHEWYASPEARRIADNIVSFQTPAGGWGKNLDFSKEPRRPGEHFVPDNLSHYPVAGDFDAPMEPSWNYVGTIDNDATTTQLRFLARIVPALGTSGSDRYRAAFLRGVDYLLAAQYPNGGWPQVWPLEGGYHDAITYNDDAMTQVMELMRSVASAQGEFAFVPAEARTRAAESFARGMRCILATQIVANGTPTIWPQQADALTLQPASARNFEPPAASPAESTGILLLLMDLPNPNAAEQRSVRTAIAWLRKTAIHGQRSGMTPQDRGLATASGAAPIWARYYQLVSDSPIFGDRDKSIHDSVDEISRERRNGYAWYGSDPQQALDRFEQWSKQHPEKE